MPNGDRDPFIHNLPHELSSTQKNERKFRVRMHGNSLGGYTIMQGEDVRADFSTVNAAASHHVWLIQEYDRLVIGAHKLQIDKNRLQGLVDRMKLLLDDWQEAANTSIRNDAPAHIAFDYLIYRWSILQAEIEG